MKGLLVEHPLRDQPLSAAFDNYAQMTFAFGAFCT
jgi:hypothetical protein